MRSQKWTHLLCGIALVASLTGCGGSPPPSMPTIVKPTSTQPPVDDTTEAVIPADSPPRQSSPDNNKALTSSEQAYVSSMQQQTKDYWANDACHYTTDAYGVTTGDMCMRASNIAGVYYIMNYDPQSSDHSGVILSAVNMNAGTTWFMYMDYMHSPRVWATVRISDPAPNADTTYLYVTIDGRTDWYPSSQVVFTNPTDGSRVPAWDSSITVTSHLMYSNLMKNMSQIPGSSY